MMNTLRRQLAVAAIATAQLALVAGVNLIAVEPAFAAQESHKKTRRTPALRSKVYDQLARAQTQADAGNKTEALNILQSVEDRKSSMNSYELAMLYNFYGFIHYNSEDFAAAISSFEQAIAQQPIPESFEMGTLFSLAQLYMMQQDYDKTVSYIERWEAINQGEVPVKNDVLKAQARYQQKDYAAALQHIDDAISKTEAEGEVALENWLILKRAVHYELKQSDKVADVIVKLIRLYDQPKYWVQLAGVYGEMEKTTEQLAILEAAYQRGYVSSEQDISNLAQLYYINEAPYKSAKLLQSSIAKGAVKKNLKTLSFLAQSWSVAKEFDKAIPVLKQATNYAEDGEIELKLAQTYLSLENYDQALDFADKALVKGGLKSESTAHLIRGMALYNQKQFDQSLESLNKATGDNSTKRMASQWLRFVESEKNTHQALQESLNG